MRRLVVATLAVALLAPLGARAARGQTAAAPPGAASGG
ncbi:MAG: hypothetical protein AVDCRST_MAG40-67, partial [uncultured Gemmatimonadaceae bacterium]